MTTKVGQLLRPLSYALNISPVLALTNLDLQMLHINLNVQQEIHHILLTGRTGLSALPYMEDCMYAHIRATCAKRELAEDSIAAHFTVLAANMPPVKAADIEIFQSEYRDDHHAGQISAAMTPSAGRLTSTWAPLLGLFLLLRSTPLFASPNPISDLEPMMLFSELPEMTIQLKKNLSDTDHIAPCETEAAIGGSAMEGLSPMSSISADLPPEDPASPSIEALRRSSRVKLTTASTPELTISATVKKAKMHDKRESGSEDSEEEDEGDNEDEHLPGLDSHWLHLTREDRWIRDLRDIDVEIKRSDSSADIWAVLPDGHTQRSLQYFGHVVSVNLFEHILPRFQQ
ncbi:hypothetical protein B0H13DRAFT_2666947 [Mycena leptocephala]|nr:hypothetical protein B0H13DRAFT_2666947 [Mycena leptocephala]